jgi:hypothetical protein
MECVLGNRRTVLDDLDVMTGSAFSWFLRIFVMANLAVLFELIHVDRVRECYAGHLGSGEFQCNRLGGMMSIAGRGKKDQEE